MHSSNKSKPGITKKLALHRDTLRHLQRSELHPVQGGQEPEEPPPSWPRVSQVLFQPAGDHGLLNC